MCDRTIESSNVVHDARCTRRLRENFSACQTSRSTHIYQSGCSRSSSRSRGSSRSRSCTVPKGGEIQICQSTRLLKGKHGSRHIGERRRFIDNRIITQTGNLYFSATQRVSVGVVEIAKGICCLQIHKRDAVHTTGILKCDCDRAATRTVIRACVQGTRRTLFDGIRTFTDDQQIAQSHIVTRITG